jgi:hypothetical protein
MAARKSTKKSNSRKAPDGIVTTAMLKRADALGKEQKEPFPEDSADLIREAREQRYNEL